MQKSFEGVLRSLIVQVLQPHRIAFQKQYEGAWNTFQHLKKEHLALERQRDSVQYRLNAIIERNGLISSEKDLEEQLQRATDNSEDESKRVQIVRDLEKQLSLLRRQMKKASKRNPGLGKRESDLQLKLNQLGAKMAIISQSISSLAKEARPFQTQPETTLLRTIVAEFHDDSNPQIISLERILSLLLDQDIKQIDLVLFFDALDEFDGHLDKLSGFLKSLVERSATSATRVKVCFSSRPWKSLNDHFAKYPGFRLQDYTKADIEQYATGSLALSEKVNSSERDEITKIIPSVTTRANGVFLWARLAMKELFDTIAESPEAELCNRLQQKLLELPTDLFEFYKLVIERISETNRRYTFALLELLTRHAGPPATATDTWCAVLISGCTTFQESLDAFQSQNISVASDWNRRVTNDISAWGGGLVEIKAHNHLQLMHQTVLEFTMDLLFKRIVVGDVAAILNENGHSFYFKYWVFKSGLREHEAATNAKLGIAAVKSHQLDEEGSKERKLAAHHAEKSESTTGISQLDFINSVPTPGLRRLFQTATPIYESNAVLLNFASSYGLTLCIRDWIARNPGELQRISLQGEQPPLLDSLFFNSARGDLHEGHITTARLILENGYSMDKDAQFFPGLLEKIWEADARRVVNDTPAAIVPAMLKLATLVLDHGQDPNIIITIVSRKGLEQCTPLHVAPPALVAQLIRHKANVNSLGSGQKTPLDWILEPPGWYPYWSLHSSQTSDLYPHWSFLLSQARRYEMCCLLVNAGGLMSPSTPAEAWTATLAEFDKEGYDTKILWSKDPSQHPDKIVLPVTRPPLPSAQRHRSPRSFLLDLFKKRKD